MDHEEYSNIGAALNINLTTNAPYGVGSVTHRGE